jgi:hypothetical protein
MCRNMSPISWTLARGGRCVAESSYMSEGFKAPKMVNIEITVFLGYDPLYSGRRLLTFCTDFLPPCLDALKTFRPQNDPANCRRKRSCPRSGAQSVWLSDVESQNFLLSEQHVLLRGKVSWCLRSHTCVGVSLACNWQLASAAREWKHALQHTRCVVARVGPHVPITYGYLQVS